MPPSASRRVERLEYLAYRSASVVANALPSALVAPTERVAARAAVRLMPTERAQVLRNIRRIHGGDLTGHVEERLVRDTFASYARYWLESLRLPGTPPEVLDAHVTVEGYEYLEEAFDRGSGVILALPHLGGWEWAAFWVTACRGHSVSAVAEMLSPELTAWFVELRRAFGIDVIPLDRDAGTASTRVLRDNRLLCLLSDRDLSGAGIPVEFFGEQTTLPAGPATLALRTGATLLTGATYFRGRDGHHLVVDPPIPTERAGTLRVDATRVTADLAGRLEALIRRAPEQWHLLQPNWPSDRDPDRPTGDGKI